MNTFYKRGVKFVIQLGGIAAADVLTVDRGRGVLERYIIESLYASKTAKRVVVTYTKFITDQEGNIEATFKSKRFEATTQETFGYFYNMIMGTNPDDLGTTLDKMVLDGLLISLFDLQQGVFGNDGLFYFPIDFDALITDGGADTFNVLLSVTDPVENEVYTYTLIDTMETNQTSIFALPAGTYTFLVESPNSMPCYKQVILSSAAVGA